MWDAQKDMLLPGCGVLITMSTVFAIRWRRARVVKLERESAYARAGR